MDGPKTPLLEDRLPRALPPHAQMAPQAATPPPSPPCSRRPVPVVLASLLLLLLRLAVPSGHSTRMVPLLLWPAAAAAAAAPSVLECFQVAQPVLTPAGATTSRDDGPPANGSACTVTLMEHVFGNSYGAPFVGTYTPPAGCAFNRVALNFTAVSQGRQFDRLALLFLGDAEIWRTSTAEPVAPPGIRWVYLLDATPYLSLWRQPQTLTFHLGNLINDKYTGSFNTTLTATFFSVPSEGQADQADQADAATVGAAAPPSDLIIPVSARQADGVVTHFTLPQNNATVTVADFPRHARRAVFSVSANGQADEEFWWSNVLSTDADAFRPTLGSALPGFSPFREVQVYVDGLLAGVQWPFPVIFTGGVVPSLHRPIVGLDVFALREHEIDLTPWLPLLGDGQPHTFSVRVVGLDDRGSSNETGAAAVLSQTVGNSWYVTGKVFVWLDGDGAEPERPATTGTPPVYQLNELSIEVEHHRQTNATGALETLYSTVSVTRALRVVSGRTGGGGAAEWTQLLAYKNEGVVSAFGFNQANTLSLTGRDRTGRRAEEEQAGQAAAEARVGGAWLAHDAYGADYSYPLFCNQTTYIAAAGNLTLWAALDQGLALNVTGAAVFPTGLEAFAGAGAGAGAGGAGVPATSTSVLHSRFNGTASFAQTGDGRNSSGFGSSSQGFYFGTGSTPLYTRDVTAVNGTVVSDDETIAGRGRTTSSGSAVPTTRAVFGQTPRGPRVFLDGRP